MNRRQFTLGALFGSIAAYQALSPTTAFAGPYTNWSNRPDVLPVDDYIDPVMASGSTDPIGMTLVIGFDISGSIDRDTNEYYAQLSAIAESIERDDFREAIFSKGGPGSIAIFMVDFDSQSKLQIGGVDFRENHPQKFRDYAERVRNLPRRNNVGGTKHIAAMKNAIRCFEAGDHIWPCQRNFVNILTDGQSIEANPSDEMVLKLAHEHGASVSSMTTLTSDYPNLLEWCDKHLRTPAGLRGPDGRAIPAGVAVQVATEMQTRQNNISRYSNTVHRSLRNQIILQANNNNAPGTDEFTRYAAADQVEMPSRRRLFTFDSLSL